MSNFICTKLSKSPILVFYRFRVIFSYPITQASYHTLAQFLPRGQLNFLVFKNCQKVKYINPKPPISIYQFYCIFIFSLFLIVTLVYYLTQASYSIKVKISLGVQNEFLPFAYSKTVKTLTYALYDTLSKIVQKSLGVSTHYTILKITCMRYMLSNQY